MSAGKTKEFMPVTPKLITWAREKAGYSLDEAEYYFKKIAEWESAVSSPTYPQVETMSDKFKVPIAVFFFPEPPEIPPVSETFRTIPESEFDRIPQRIKALLYKAKAFQISLAELNGNKNPVPRLITKDLQFKTSTSINRMASKVREYLGVPLEEQISWKTSGEALKKWREAVANIGVYAFKDSFKQRNYCGFCLYDDEFPIIYINNTTAENRQIFSIFHELAHLIFHTSGIDVVDENYVNRLPNNAQKIEIICNRFAGKFLVPDVAFKSESANMHINRDTVSLLADKFNVSRHVIYRKYLEAGMISDREYNSAIKELEKQPIKKGGGGDYYNTTMTYLGRPYVRLAFEGYYQGRFDKVQLADYLNVKPINVIGIEERLLRAGQG